MWLQKSQLDTTLAPNNKEQTDDICKDKAPDKDETAAVAMA